jgi:hypothetical protein
LHACLYLGFLDLSARAKLASFLLLPFALDHLFTRRVELRRMRAKFFSGLLRFGVDDPEVLAQLITTSAETVTQRVRLAHFTLSALTTTVDLGELLCGPTHSAIRSLELFRRTARALLSPFHVEPKSIRAFQR